MSEYNINKIIGMGDNSTYPVSKPQLKIGGTGWHGYLTDTFTPWIKEYNLKHILIRQPFPTPQHINWLKPTDGSGADTGWRRVPMWFTGWYQSILDGEDTLRLTFKTGVRLWKKENPGVEFWAYVGHAGGDVNTPELEAAGRVPWASDPILEDAFENGGSNRFRDIFDKCFSPLDYIGAHVFFDASGRVQQNSKYGATLNMYQTLTTLDGRHFGIESPSHQEWNKHWSVAAVWGVRQGNINAGAWFNRSGPRLVFVMPQPQDGIVVRGDIGGWSKEAHDLVRERVKEAINVDDFAVVPLHAVFRAGFKTIEDWLDWKNAPVTREPDPVPVSGQPGDITGDGFVGIEDLNTILLNWNKQVTPGTNGDLTGDGFVGIEDLNLVLMNWNKGQRPASIDPTGGPITI